MIDKMSIYKYFWVLGHFNWGHRAMTEDRRVSPTTELGQGSNPVAGAASVASAASRPGVEAGAVRHAIERKRSERTIKASAQTQHALDQTGALARSNAAVVIRGPEGSGRTHFAHILHEWSARASAPVLHFSAAVTAEGLQARELFGVSAEADPLSSGGARGALVEAGNGTLIIERLDLLTPALRNRLAQALRESQIVRDGAPEPMAVRARIVATANDKTKDGSKDNAGDLLAGIPMQTLDLSALADRREDILPLAAHFLSEFADEQGVEPVGFTVDARRWLVEEPWTGNARELRERVRQAVQLSSSGALSAEALMLSTEGEDVPSFKDAKRAFETRYVEGLLRRCSGNISRAARLAKKDRKDFYDVIRRTGVDPTEFRP